VSNVETLINKHVQERVLQAASEGPSCHQTNRGTNQNVPMSKSFSRTQAVNDCVSISEEDDRILIRHITAKDRETFEMFYYRYTPRLEGYLSKLLKSRELVEEVINDVMLVVWQKAARFEPTVRLSTWLFGIAHHKALKALARSSRLSPELLSVSLEASEAEDSEDSTDPPAPDDPEQT
jgi:hypothetical protein